MWAYGQSHISTISGNSAVTSTTKGITFNLTSTNSITIDSIKALIDAVGIVDVWYSAVPINGSPNISNIKGWKLAGSVLVSQISPNNGSPILIPLALNIPVFSGQTIAIAIGSTVSTNGASLRYKSSSTVQSFTDGTVTLTTDFFTAFGGYFPKPFSNPRVFAGTIYYSLPRPCSLSNAPLQAEASSNSVCFGGSFTLNLLNDTFKQGNNYSWQSSADNMNWSSIPNGNSPLVGINNLMLPTYYRCVENQICGTTTSRVSNSVLVSPGVNSSCYCLPNGGNENRIKKVSIKNTTLQAEPLDSTYFFGEAISPYTSELIKGNTYDIVVTSKHFTNFYGYKTVGWIDYNQNLQFEPSEIASFGPVNSIGRKFEGQVTIPNNAVSGNTVLRIIQNWEPDTVQAFLYGCIYEVHELKDFIVTIKDEKQNDAAIADVPNQQLFNCSVIDSVIVTIKNWGTNALNNVTINWEVNNITQTPFTYTGNLQTNSISNSVYIGNYPFTNGDILKIWTSMPNLVPDSNAVNDTISIVVHSSLSGTYTIGGPNADYHSISAATSDLNNFGICGNTTFLLADSIYEEVLHLESIHGCGPTAQIRFQSYSNNAANCIIKCPEVEFPNWVIETNNVKFNNFTFYSPNYSSLSNQTCFNGLQIDDSLLFNNVSFLYDTLGDLEYDAIALVHVDNLSVSNSTIIANNRAISLYSNFPESTESAYIHNNQIVTNRDGIRLSNAQNIVVTNNNLISHFAGGSAIYITGTNGEVECSYNKASNFKIGLYILESNNSFSSIKKANVFNNFFGVSSQQNNSTAITLGFNTINFISNSINMYNSITNSTALNIRSQCKNASIVNNTITCSECIPISFTSSYDSITCDYNNLYTTGPAIGKYQNMTVLKPADLSSWQSITGFDTHSLSIPVSFVSENDLHHCTVQLEDKGIAVSSFTNDIDNDPRINLPDIGADEINARSNVFSSDTLALCDNSTIEIVPNDFYSGNYLINGLAYSGNFQIDQTGTYYFSVLGNCGVQADVYTVIGQSYIQLPSDVFLCEIDTIKIVPNFTEGTFSWSTGANYIPYTVYEPGNYILTFTDTNGCISMDSILVENQTYPDPTFSYTLSNSVFNGQITNIENGTLYYWVLSPTITLQGPIVMHTYAQTDDTATVTAYAYTMCDTLSSSLFLYVNNAEELVNHNKLMVYPNPANTSLNLKNTTNKNINATYRILDTQGRIVATNSFNWNGNQEHQIDISALVNGMYLIAVETVNGIETIPFTVVKE